MRNGAQEDTQIINFFLDVTFTQVAMRYQDAV